MISTLHSELEPDLRQSGQRLNRNSDRRPVHKDKVMSRSVSSQGRRRDDAMSMNDRQASTTKQWWSDHEWLVTFSTVRFSLTKEVLIPNATGTGRGLQPKLGVRSHVCTRPPIGRRGLSTWQRMHEWRSAASSTFSISRLGFPILSFPCLCSEHSSLCP